jgi:hypothetical protein
MRTGLVDVMLFPESSNARRPTMNAWMNGAMVIEATLTSFLFALWLAWMSLLGLFRMLPAKKSSQGR